MSESGAYFMRSSLSIKPRLAERLLGAKIKLEIGASISFSGAHPPAMTWHEYHEAVKHSVQSLKRGRHVHDWANMPAPFRYYEGVPVLDLPADPPAPEIPSLAGQQVPVAGTQIAVAAPQCAGGHALALGQRGSAPCGALTG
jgi:hypothetical protein